MNIIIKCDFDKVELKEILNIKGHQLKIPAKIVKTAPIDKT